MNRNFAADVSRLAVVLPGALALLWLSSVASVCLAGEPPVRRFVWGGARDGLYDWDSATGDELVNERLEYDVTPGKGSVTLFYTSGGKVKAGAKIVVAANPTRSAWIAAQELNHYLEKMGGARLPIVSDEVKPFEGAKVLVGESKLTRALGLSNDTFEQQQYMIRTYGDMLVLMGYDEPIYGTVDVDYEGSGFWPGFTSGRDWSPKPWWSYKFGTCYAVDTFLEKSCGIRWYMPGEIGEVCPSRTALTVSDLDSWLQPWTTYRWTEPHYLSNGCYDYFNFVGSGREPIGYVQARGASGWRDVFLWMLRMKLLGIEAYGCNHSLIGAVFKRRFPEETEIMAQGYPDPTQLCLTSERLVEIVLSDVRGYFSEKSNYERSVGDYFRVMPHDTGDYCKCPRCQAVVRDKEDVRGSSSVGFWSNRASNYVWGLVNQVAEDVKEEFPGKWAACCSYAAYTLPPDNIELSDNVAVTLCRVLIDGIKYPEYKKFYEEEQVGEWSKRVKRWYLWDYFDHIQGNSGETANFPGIFLHRIAEDIQFLKRHGCRGLFNELSSPRVNAAMDHLIFYVQMKLLDDADLDVDEMFDEYCRLFYGPAAEPMKHFFSLLEERYCDPDNWKLAPGQTSVDWEVICPPPVLERFGSFIEQATALATEDPYRTRVRLMSEAIYGVMRQNCLRHAQLAESGATKLSAPFLDDPDDGLTHAGGNHVESFVTMGGNPTDIKTEAWVGYDRENLYVRVKCCEDDMKRLETDARLHEQKQGDVWTNDVLELFIDVGRTRKDYFQIIGNTNGVIKDGRWPGADWSFLSHTSLEVLSVPAEKYWMLDFVVPLTHLTGGEPVKSGDVWGFNICRNRLGGPDKYTAWCPTVRGFHVPNAFGSLTFQ